MKLELHAIHSVPVSCLNRDELNQPKSAIYGGVPRIRVSSQCWKRSMREYMRDLLPDLFKGVRSRQIQTLLSPIFETKGINPIFLDEVANVLSKVEKDHVTTVLYLSPGELERIADAVAPIPVEEKEEKGEVKKVVDSKAVQKAVKKAISDFALADAADIILFGRMFANDPSLNVDGSAYFNHPITTHAAESESDFFTSMDEVNRGDSGAGMMGSIEFSSGTFYRYVCLDIDEIKRAFPSANEEFIAAFVKSFILAIPQAKRASMNASSTPNFVLATLIKSGQNQQLVEAFENPITSREGYINPSVEAVLKTYQNKVEAGYIEPIFEGVINTTSVDSSLQKYKVNELASEVASKALNE